MYALIQIIALLTNVVVMLVIIQFIIGLLFAFNVVSSSTFASSVAPSVSAGRRCSHEFMPAASVALPFERT